MTAEQFLHQEVERAPRGFVTRVMHTGMTIAELRAMTRNEMLRTPNLGTKMVAHLRYLLDKYPEPEWQVEWCELADLQVLPQ